MSITWIDVIGYIASLFVALSFYSKVMIPLRIFGLFSNCFFIMYGGLTHAYPILILHVFLLPMNLYRLYQMKKLLGKVKESATGMCTMDCLVPFMTQRKFQKGDVLFKKGDTSDSMFYIIEGSVHLAETDRMLAKGSSLGEFGVFSPLKERTLTASAAEDSDIGVIAEDKILQLFYQNPAFGFFIIRLVISRYLEYSALYNK